MEVSTWQDSLREEPVREGDTVTTLVWRSMFRPLVSPSIERDTEPGGSGLDKSQSHNEVKCIIPLVLSIHEYITASECGERHKKIITLCLGIFLGSKHWNMNNQHFREEPRFF